MMCTRMLYVQCAHWVYGCRIVEEFAVYCILFLCLFSVICCWGDVMAHYGMYLQLRLVMSSWLWCLNSLLQQIMWIIVVFCMYIVVLFVLIDFQASNCWMFHVTTYTSSWSATTNVCDELHWVYRFVAEYAAYCGLVFFLISTCLWYLFSSFCVVGEHFSFVAYVLVLVPWIMFMLLCIFDADHTVSLLLCKSTVFSLLAVS